MTAAISPGESDPLLCGAWMPRAKEPCGRKPNHQGDHRKASTMLDKRAPKTERRVGYTIDPAAHKKWNSAYRLRRYGLTRKQFDWLLEVQGYACAMGGEPFTEDSVICIDHDHKCCKEEKRSCGKCVRGLLCMDCNTALGHIERKLKLAGRYLFAAPGKLLPAA